MCQCVKTLSAKFIFVLYCIGVQNIYATELIDNQASLYIDSHDISILINETKEVILELRGKPERETDITFEVQHNELLTIYPNTLKIIPSDKSDKKWTLYIMGHEPGHTIVAAYNKTLADGLDLLNAFIRVTIQHSYLLEYISTIVGWTYFFAWSVSFYPQIYQNWKRKSVVGLNFDFLSLNILGFSLYGIFNIGLYYIPEIQEMYFERHPRGTNPVQLNDVVFAVHAAFATAITILQCYCYESGTQRVSTIARSLLCLFFLIIMTVLGLSLFNYITWLDFLYYCSTIKLTITLIKYIPQAYMNYQRKSTIGWSIGNVFLDFTGGTLSMAQMIINAYNYDDWESIFGDTTKFGLGLFSVFFDIFFIVQHYILYRGQSYEIMEGVNTASS
ncbi:lysosomal cystine transporter cystinosin isoform X2 [Lycorma delicatula]|uniref:lysosomal cystine transporter cystinosin isoform X2 n=1 Tax=Lycorma delicatula TaxID=130591 RepID=UPI003F519D65